MPLAEVLRPQWRHDLEGAIDDQSLVNGVHVVDLEVDQDASAGAVASRDRRVVGIQDRDLRGIATQADVLGRLEGRLESEVFTVERAGSGDVAGHQDRVAAGDFHRALFTCGKNVYSDVRHILHT